METIPNPVNPKGNRGLKVMLKSNDSVAIPIKGRIPTVLHIPSIILMAKTMDPTWEEFFRRAIHNFLEDT